MNQLEKTDLEFTTTFNLINDWNKKQVSSWIPAKNFALAISSLLLVVQELNYKLENTPDGYEKVMDFCQTLMVETKKSSNQYSVMGSSIIEVALIPFEEMNKKIQGQENIYEQVSKSVKAWADDVSTKDELLNTSKNSLTITLNLLDKLNNKVDATIEQRLTNKSTLKM